MKDPGALIENKRWLVLDLIKGIAIFVMVFSHVVVWWYLEEDAVLAAGSGVSAETLNIFLKTFGVFSIYIPITAGMAFWFFSQKGFDRNKRSFIVGKFPFLRTTFFRAIFLIVCGFLMNILAFGPEDLFAWDALQFIGVSLFFSLVMLKLIKLEFWCFLSLILFFSVDLLRGIFLPFQTTYLYEVLFGGGFVYLPFLRFYILFVFGFIIGYLYDQTKENKQKFYRITLSYGVFFSIIYFISTFNFFTFDTQNWWGSIAFAPKGLFLGATGVFSLFVFLGDRYFSSMKLSRYNLFNVYSRGIFFVYIFHIIFGYHFSNYLKGKGSDGISLFVCVLINLALSYIVGLLYIMIKEKSWKTPRVIN